MAQYYYTQTGKSDILKRAIENHKQDPTRNSWLDITNTDIPVYIYAFKEKTQKNYTFIGTSLSSDNSSGSTTYYYAVPMTDTNIKPLTKSTFGH